MPPSSLMKTQTIYMVAIISCGLLLCGCNSGSLDRNDGGIVTTEQMTARQFKDFAVRAGWSLDGPLIFPQLRIYDRGGSLVTLTYDSNEASRILSTLPVMPKPHQYSAYDSLHTLAVSLSDLPSQRVPVEHSRSETVVAVSLDGCHGCGVQDDALQSASSTLVKNRIDVLKIYVAPN